MHEPTRKIWKRRRAFTAYMLVDVFGLTQEEAGEIMDYSQQSVGRYLRYYYQHFA